MTQFTLLFASILGGLAVIFGAFGAHALKKILSEDQLKSFETGVKYQMYHAINAERKQKYACHKTIHHIFF